MFNINSLKSPLRNFPSHEISSDAVFFISEDSYRYSITSKTKIVFSIETPRLQKNQQILVLEHAIGPNGNWLKIKTFIDNEEKIGYILFNNNIIPINDTLPFYLTNVKEDNLPNLSAPQINWKTQKPNIPYEDNYNGSYVVHVELEDTTQLGDEQLILQKMELARIRGTKIILDYLGFIYTDEKINILLNNFYSFSTAEEWFIDPRPCSTLRVAVSIPKRYLFAKSGLKNSVGEEKKPTQEEEKPEYFTLKFKDYDQYKLYFDKIISDLQKQQFLFTSRQWIIDPEISINFLKEINDIQEFVNETNNLIAKNHPKFYSEIFSSWKNSLDIVIDRQKLEIVNIKYYNAFPNLVRYSLDAGFTSYLLSPVITNKTIINYLLNFPIIENLGAAIDGLVNSLPDTISSTFAPEETKLQLKKFLNEKHYPKINDITAKPLDLFQCSIDTITRIRELESIKIPSEIRKWQQINKQYEKEKFNIEGDMFLRAIKQGPWSQDPNLRILFGYDKLTGSTEEQFIKYINVAQAVDWAKFLGVATQCMTRTMPINDVLSLMNTYSEARKSIDNIFAATVCNPFLKNGLKVINSFQLPTFPVYNPNASLLIQLENALYKILMDIVSLGIKTALEQAAKACTSDPSLNFNKKSPIPNLNESVNDPALTDLLNNMVNNNLPNASSTNIDKDEAKSVLQKIISDISTCLSLTEMCSLYKGTMMNEDIYQIISSLIKRKYGDPYAKSFATKEQIYSFFKALGNNLDLSACDDLTTDEEPNFIDNEKNVLCDDGKIKNLRKDILSDKGLTSELIDSVLEAKRKEEAKALEDVLKLLNSDNPFDFSKVPDLGCRVFPDGSSIAPSMQSFAGTLNTLLNSIYDSFDQEAREWFRTTYSVSGSGNNFLQFNTATGKIEQLPSDNLSIKQETTDKVKSAKENSTKIDDSSQKKASDSAIDLQEFKLPSYLFKKVLNINSSVSYNNVENFGTSSFFYISVIDGSEQQNLDVNFIQNSLRKEIEIGESLLKNFCNALLSQILAKLTVEGARLNLEPIRSLLISIDAFLRNNISDAEVMRVKLKELYKKLGLNDSQESNGFFAAYNGAALYLVICEELINKRGTLDTIISLSSTPVFTGNSSILRTINSTYNPATTLQSLLGTQNDDNVPYPTVLGQYSKVKNYYRSILNIKINYPDFKIEYNTGLDKINFNDKQYTTFFENKYYELQKTQIEKNGFIYLQSSEITPLSNDIQSFITSLNVEQTNINKQKIFKKYFDLKREKYGGPIGKQLIEIDNKFDITYSLLYQEAFTNIRKKILSRNNKFITLKNLKNPDQPSVLEFGFGQPYTQYLKLIVEQTAQQIACNVRPHYLDIDSLKNQILEEKANNICVEKIADERVASEKPINTDELRDLETSSTQAAMLRGMYRLTIRIFLHDLLLRGISIFGVYDPQQLRNEPAFISFMANMCESEMRGMDNKFFIMLSDFLLEAGKDSYQEEKNQEIKKSLLFKDVVKQELKDYVLPKLAKRIHYDTNLVLQNNTPKDNPIILNSIDQQLEELNILTVENNNIFLNLKFKTDDPELILQNFEAEEVYTIAKQKIFEGSLSEFRATDEYKFLFTYILPLTQILNNFFMINCLSTSTRRQVVNCFSATKRDAIMTCKIIQTNGQETTPNLNDSQAISNDPVQLVIGFIIQALIKAPILILKGYAEITEPNLKLVTSIYNAAKIAIPDLTSFIIPAASYALGGLPPPLPRLVPYIDPLLVAAYMGTFAWYDDEPLDNVINSAIKELEKVDNKDKKCENIINNDAYYADQSTQIEKGNYDITRDIQQLGGVVLEKSPEQILFEEKERFIKVARDKIIEKQIFPIVKEGLTYYINYTKASTVQIQDLITDNEIKNYINDAVTVKEQEISKNNISYKLLTKEDSENINMPILPEFDKFITDCIELSLRKGVEFLDTKL